jgi:hypothetical protein
MSQLSKIRQSRNQWKRKASQRATDNRYLRRELARAKRERDEHKRDRQAAEVRLHDNENRQAAVAVRTKVDVIELSLRLFLEARLSFRAVSRALGCLALVLGLKRAPCPQSVINWVMRLSLVRLQSAPAVGKSPLRADPFANGSIWLIDISITLGAGQILAILALDARHHERYAEAPTLRQVRCIAVAVADSWDGARVAAFIQRLIAVQGRPVAYLKDGGSELQNAVERVAQDGLASATIADISHVVANLLKRRYQDHPQFTTFLSVCGRISGRLKQTLLACLVPPRVPTKARFMNVHRLVNWADRVLKLSPPGGAASGSMLAKLRAALDDLPTCRALLKSFHADATALMACQQIVKTRGLSHDTLSACQDIIGQIPSATVREPFNAYLRYQLQTATELELDQVGMPISSDAIESLFGVAKRHGTGELHDAGRIALRVPALCGELTREDAQAVATISVAQQREFSAGLPSLTKQRREVFAHSERLEELGRDQPKPIELIAGSKKCSTSADIISLPPDQSLPRSMGYGEPSESLPECEMELPRRARASP